MVRVRERPAWWGEFARGPPPPLPTYLVALVDSTEPRTQTPPSDAAAKRSVRPRRVSSQPLAEAAGATARGVTAVVVSRSVGRADIPARRALEPTTPPLRRLPIVAAWPARESVRSPTLRARWRLLPRSPGFSARPLSGGGHGQADEPSGAAPRIRCRRSPGSTASRSRPRYITAGDPRRVRGSAS
jgi:hypothetical protein